MLRCYGRRISQAYGKSHTRRQRDVALTGGVTSDGTARITTGRIRIRWIRVAGLLLAFAAIAVFLAQQLPASSSPAAGSLPRLIPGGHRGALGEADGAVPDGTTVFDDAVPGVARLDPALLDALRRAAGDAALAGVEFRVDSGWRSPGYQRHLFREAVAKYGSAAAAARWVATPDTSSHVLGEAVDIGPAGAAAWLSAHGAVYGLCQVYGNEPWHLELRPEATQHGCPPTYSDPTQDPRSRHE